MLLEHVLSQVVWSLDRYDVVQALLLLLPKQRNAASDLYEAIQVAFAGHDEFALDKVCHVRVVVDASRDESSPCHRVATSGDEHDFNFLILDQLPVLLDETLYDWNEPEGTYILVPEIFGDVKVEHIPVIELTVSQPVELHQSLWLFAKLRLPLNVARNVSMVAEVEALLLEHLLDSVDILDSFQLQLPVVRDVLVEGNQIHLVDPVDSVTRWKSGYEFASCDYHHEQPHSNVHDANDPKGRKLQWALVVIGLQLYS